VVRTQTYSLKPGQIDLNRETECELVSSEWSHEATSKCLFSLLLAAAQCYSVRSGQELQSGGLHVREAGEKWVPVRQAQLSGWYDGSPPFI